MVVFELAALLVSVAILSKAAEVVVDNITILASFFRIDHVAIGFLLLAVSTSLPELSVSVVSASHGSGSIAAGNVFGSNIANIFIVLGIGAFMYGMRIGKSELRDIGLVLLLTTVISAYIVFSSTVQQRALNFFEGAVLLGLFAAYAYNAVKSGKGYNCPECKTDRKAALHAFLLFCGSIVAVIISSGFVVEYAVSLASEMGLAQSFIGSTIIAIGTSLPEISTGLHAIRKRKYGMALGNAVGSNMANLTLVLGTASVLSPIHVQLPVFIAALLFAVVANMLLLYVAAVNRGIRRTGGALFLILYAVFLASIFALQIGEISPP